MRDLSRCCQVFHRDCLPESHSPPVTQKRLKGFLKLVGSSSVGDHLHFMGNVNFPPCRKGYGIKRNTSALLRLGWKTSVAPRRP